MIHLRWGQLAFARHLRWGQLALARLEVRGIPGAQMRGTWGTRPLSLRMTAGLLRFQSGQLKRAPHL
jgi:hypothetical protein